MSQRSVGVIVSHRSVGVIVSQGSMWSHSVTEVSGVIVSQRSVGVSVTQVSGVIVLCGSVWS